MGTNLINNKIKVIKRIAYGFGEDRTPFLRSGRRFSESVKNVKKEATKPATANFLQSG